MKVEYLGEKIFLDEIKASGQIWVARGTYKNIYSLVLDQSGVSLPVWSSAERVYSFLSQARPIGQKYEPESLDLTVFINAWLADKKMSISELHVNPDGKSSRVLVFTVDEFKTSQGSV